MSRLLALLGSTKLAAGLLALLVLHVFVFGRNGGFDSDWLSIPLSLLSINLLTAIVVNAAFRQQPALLAFHVCLLAVVVLACLGALTGFSGRVEVTEGGSLDASRIEIIEAGVLHRGRPESEGFIQGKINVDYLRNRVRQATSSDVSLRTPAGAGKVLRVGDRTTFVVDGYRYSTTVNKGFSLILAWTPHVGDTAVGAVNFPSYPEFDWMQTNSWTTPTGELLDLELILAGPSASDRAWRLQSEGQAFSVKLTRNDGTTDVLHQGQSTKLRGGTIGVQGLRLWMGYRVDSNPTLPWLLAAALLAVLSLTVHFNIKYRRSPKRREFDTEEDRHVLVR